VPLSLASLAPHLLDTYAEKLIGIHVVHEIHTSERRSFRGCRRRWSWVYQENLYPPTTPRPLEFGIAYHKAMEVLHSPTTWRFPPAILCALAEKAFVDTCEEQRKKYLEAKDLFALEGDESADYDERVELGRGMIRYYVEHQLTDLQKEYTPSHVEVSFHVPLKDEQKQYMFCKCKGCRRAFAKAGGTQKLGRWIGNPVVISGRVDLVVYDDYGNYWLWDWKTAARMATSEVFLELDDQIATYCWAVRIGLGLNIQGFLYHEQLKGFPEPPKENKVIRLGRKFSVAANQTTDYETYLATVREHDTAAYEAGLYDDFLKQLKEVGTTFYQRFKIYKTDYELWQVYLNLLAEVRDITSPNLQIYPTPGRFSCNNCAFQVPCISKNQGHDYQYTLDTMYVKKEPYYRNEIPASTENKGRL
jgi:hypothetical protein